jgi:hypothetical protein
MHRLTLPNRCTSGEQASRKIRANGGSERHLAMATWAACPSCVSDSSEGDRLLAQGSDGSWPPHGVSRPGGADGSFPAAGVKGRAEHHIQGRWYGLLGEHQLPRPPDEQGAGSAR